MKDLLLDILDELKEVVIGILFTLVFVFIWIPYATYDYIVDLIRNKKQ